MSDPNKNLLWRLEAIMAAFACIKVKDFQAMQKADAAELCEIWQRTQKLYSKLTTDIRSEKTDLSK